MGAFVPAEGFVSAELAGVAELPEESAGAVLEPAEPNTKVEEGRVFGGIVARGGYGMLAAAAASPLPPF